MVLEPRKSWIQRFKWIIFRSWNERVITNWIKVVQRAWQRHWLQLKIEATSYNLFRANQIWFWILGSQKSSASNKFQLKVETREIWLIEARLRKEHDNTVTLNSIQNWGYLPWVFWGKPHMVFKLRKSKFQCFKRIAIGVETRKIWLIKERLHKGHIVIGLSLGQILFWLFRLIFWASFWAQFFRAHWVFLFSLTLSLVVGLFW